VPTRLLLAVFLVLAMLAAREATAQSPKSTAPTKKPVPNYDEALVPKYTLPELLKLNDGTPATDRAGWARRRGELLELYRTQVFGRSPGRPVGLRWTIDSTDSQALGGKATRKQLTIDLVGDPSGPRLHLLVYIPNAAKGPVPTVLGYNFQGNHTISTDPGITLAQGWFPAKAVGVVDGRATDAARGAQASRWPVELILGRGYALATAYYADVEPDHADGWRDGVRGWLRVNGERRDRSADATTSPDHRGAPPEAAADDWGAIGAWAWGLSRALDCLEADSQLDPRRVIVFGHSRLGKTSLWAGAQDERFAMTISNDSGEGGAALARRRIGERTENLNTSFPHWFCGTFKQYSGREDALPVDAHELLALTAPRPLYVASAINDRWADPRGEFLSALSAEPAWKLFGLSGLNATVWPAIDTPIGGTVGYHVRTGGHDVTSYDWERYLDFADRELGRK